jgi:hypothetical protein
LLEPPVDDGFQMHRAFSNQDIQDHVVQNQKDMKNYERMGTETKPSMFLTPNLYNQPGENASSSKQSLRLDIANIDS